MSKDIIEKINERIFFHIPEQLIARDESATITACYCVHGKLYKASMTFTAHPSESAIEELLKLISIEEAPVIAQKMADNTGNQKRKKVNAKPKPKPKKKVAAKRKKK